MIEGDSDEYTRSALVVGGSPSNSDLQQSTQFFPLNLDVMEQRGGPYVESGLLSQVRATKTLQLNSKVKRKLFRVSRITESVVELGT
ncbi:hypothetical protein PIB30_060095, partial [Stylosanthes scabra]|nr:hypothetical protein [Stylosanthes scabra]